MSKPVLTSHGLKILAEEIRTRHDEHICTCPCEGFCSVGAPPPPEPEFDDEADRRWAAKKLTVPIEPEDDGDDFTPEDWIEVYCQVWKMRTGVSQRHMKPQVRFQRMADQLKHSSKFAQNMWKLGDGKAEEQEEQEEKKEGEPRIGLYDDIEIAFIIEDLFGSNDDEEDDDVSHLDLSATSEDPGPPIPPEFDPNPGKIH